jgi:hypothetical protein
VTVSLSARPPQAIPKADLVSWAKGKVFWVVDYFLEVAHPEIIRLIEA